MSTVNSVTTDLDAVVVGAGFAGIYSLQNLRTKDTVACKYIIPHD